MGGRIYDASIGRFMQADPFIQAPNNTQSFNRYSYVLNNPMSYTDPSGFISLNPFKAAKKLRRSLIRGASKIFGADLVNIVGSAIATYFGGAWGAGAWSYEFARAHGVSSSGAMRGAIASFAGVYVGGSEWYQGLSDFGQAAVQVGIDRLGQTPEQSNDQAAYVTQMQTVGNTISNLTGDKFANGATTAAFAQAFNGEDAAKKFREQRAHLKPTDSEYEMVQEGKLADMWKSRCERGDPIGCVGYGTWGDPSDVSENVGNYWVGVGATVRANAYAGLYSANGAAPSDALMLQFGQDIAIAHLDATATDLSSINYYLSAPEITSYHHTVFDSYGVNRGFYGGSWATGSHDRTLEIFYCQPACDYGKY